MPVAAGLPIWASILLSVGIAAASSYLVYVLTPRPKLVAQNAAALTRTARGSILPWRAVYGTARVGGALVFHYDGSGAGAYAWQVIVVACHEVDEITQLWADDTQVTLGSWTTQSGTDDYADGTGDWADRVRVYRHHGAADQVVNPHLDTAAGAYWGTNHRLRGRAYIVLRLSKNADSWPNGIPNWSVVVKGKLVYDPRSDTTAWSANAALCVADYLYNASYGLGAGAISGGVYTEINDAALVAAANICDEDVDLDAGGTEDRYTLNGAFDTDSPHEDILERMLTAMAGTLVYAEGQWHVHAGAHTASVQTITEDDLVAPVRVTSRLSRSELFNRVKGTYVSAANKYLPSDYPVVASSTYATEDGEVLTLDHDLPFTASPAMAQRLAKIELEQCRQQITVALKCKLTCLQLRPPDRCAVTLSRFGWSAKMFKVVESSIEIEPGDDGSPVIFVALTLRETATTIYDWDETTEETAVDSAPDTLLDDPLTISAPSNLALSDISTVTDDGRIRSYVKATWDAVDDPKLVSYEVQWKSSATNWPTASYQTHPVEAVASPEAIVGPVLDDATTTVRVRAIARSGLVSSWASDTLAVDADESDYRGRLGGRNYGTRPLFRDGQAGVAQDGDSVTFSPAFSNPVVQFTPRCLTYDSATLSGSQRLRLAAQDLTGAGFTMIAKLAETGATITGRTATFSGTDAVKSETPEAYDDNYTFQFDVTLTPTAALDAIAHLTFWARPSAGTWTQYAERWYERGAGEGTQTLNDLTVMVNVDGQGASAEFRVTLEGDSQQSSVNRDQVSWGEATFTEVSATPNADTVVDWLAWESGG